MSNNNKKQNNNGPMGGGGPGLRHSLEKPKNFKKTLKDLVRYLKPYKVSIILAFIAAIASSIFSIIGPKILGNATTEIFNGLIAKITGIGGINFDALWKILFFLLGLYIISNIFWFFENFLMSNVTQKMSYTLRKNISKKMNTLPISYFDKNTKGDILSRITNDVDTVSSNLNQSLTTIISAITTMLGVLIMMLSINVTMTLVSLLIIPLSLVFMAFVVKRSQKYFVDQQKYLGDVNGQVEEVYGGHLIVKAFNAEEQVTEEFNQYNERLYETGYKSQFLSGLMQPMMKFIGNLGYVVVAILGGYLTIKGTVDVGAIVSFSQYIRNFTQPMTQLAQITSMIQSTLAAAERVFEFLDESDEKPVKSPIKVNNIKNNIEFKNINFGYTEEKTVINNFSIKVKEGMKVAIVGPTGAGKTTLVKLLMRFYDVNSGEILIDGHNINDFNRKDLRSLFGMVFQDTWVFSGTIEDNIKYGKLDSSREEVIEAAKAAHIHHYIKTLPDGYDMIVNEESSNISQGQKQLLTIARVILSDPKILILDEATSSVDTRTEVLIQKAMDNLMEGRTSFIIAHRLSTIRNADIILVINNGDIVETGNHEQLLKKDGFYANLYNSQFQDFDEEE